MASWYVVTPSAGSAYTYAQKSISLDRWLYGGLVLAARLPVRADDQHSAGENLFLKALVPSIPSWVFVIALVAFMTAFNLRSIKSVANFNTVIVVLQVVPIAVILARRGV